MTSKSVTRFFKLGNSRSNLLVLQNHFNRAAKHLKCFFLNFQFFFFFIFTVIFFSHAMEDYCILYYRHTKKLSLQLLTTAEPSVWPNLPKHKPYFEIVIQFLNILIAWLMCLRALVIGVHDCLSSLGLTFLLNYYFNCSKNWSLKIAVYIRKCMLM